MIAPDFSDLDLRTELATLRHDLAEQTQRAESAELSLRLERAANLALQSAHVNDVLELDAAQLERDEALDDVSQLRYALNVAETKLERMARAYDALLATQQPYAAAGAA